MADASNAKTSSAGGRKLRQAIQRIDHLAMIVYLENFDAYIAKLSDLLGIQFDEAIRSEDVGVTAAVSWDSGLEIIAPLHKEGWHWDRLQRFGEGSTVLIFGVNDIEEAAHRAERMGFKTREIRLQPEFPWLKRFRSFRESKVEAFPPEFAMGLAFSEIIPREAGDEGECQLVNPIV